MKNALLVAAGALMLIWPALLNHYPIVFSDTGAFLAQAAAPDEVFDKPWAYAPFLLALDGCTSLWLPLAGQGLLLSHILWLVGKSLGAQPPISHLLICAVLALATAAPFVTSLLMPDVFAPITVLCILLLADDDRLSELELDWVLAISTLAIASHLSHLIIAACCLPPLWLLRARGKCRPADWRPVLPLLGATMWLLGVNATVYHRVAVSPYGSVFMLARLVEDGPATIMIRKDCSTPGGPRWWICDWQDKLPRDSDAFLWDPAGPIWAAGSGPTLHAAEASRLVAETFRYEPVATAQAMLRNTARQLGRNAIGDTLGPDWLNATVGLRLQQHFPAEEQKRFAASLQAQDELRNKVSTISNTDSSILVLGAITTLILLIIAMLYRLRDVVRLCAVVLVGVLANAFATGALSGPHDRYGVRMTWLLVAVPCLVAAVCQRRSISH